MIYTSTSRFVSSFSGRICPSSCHSAWMWSKMLLSSRLIWLFNIYTRTLTPRYTFLCNLLVWDDELSMRVWDHDSVDLLAFFLLRSNVQLRRRVASSGCLLSVRIVCITRLRFACGWLASDDEPHGVRLSALVPGRLEKHRAYVLCPLLPCVGVQYKHTHIWS